MPPIDYSKWDKIVDSDEEDDNNIRQRDFKKSSNEIPKDGIMKERCNQLDHQMSEMKLHREKKRDELDEAELPPLEFLPAADADQEAGKGKPKKLTPAVVDFWLTKMTQPQRIMQFGIFWNQSEMESRKLYLRTLIEVIGDAAKSNYIKGGQQILENMDLEPYATVSYCAQWVEDFQKFSQEERIDVFRSLYSALELYEQDFIVAGLSGSGFPTGS